MVIDLFRWPPQAWPFQEVLAAAVESFSSEGRHFDRPGQSSLLLNERLSVRASLALVSQILAG
jgi:hypothetical protein